MLKMSDIDKSFEYGQTSVVESHERQEAQLSVFFKAASSTSDATEVPKRKQLSLTVNNAD